MPAAFLHGIEIIELTTGPVPVQIVKSAVIGLVGTAPTWDVPATAPVQPPAPNAPMLVSSARDGSAFGPLMQGYTIPRALAAIQAQGAGQAIVVNVFDPTVHNSVVASLALSFPATGAVQVINLGHMGILGGGGALGTASKPVVKNSGGTVTYVEGTDYTVDYINGLITAKSGGALTASEAITVGFSYADPTKVTTANIAGAVTNGVYTGAQALLTTFQTMGFFAKVLIAPGYTHNSDNVVAAALLTIAGTIRAMALIDSPPGTTVATAIANRGVAGNPFDTSSKRAILCFPQEKFTDTGIIPTGVTTDANGNPILANADATAVAPYSQWVAGVIAAKDLDKGYWFSPSNTEVIGILGPDVTVIASAFDANSDVNTLNSDGILTVFNFFGTGLRVWGNRSAAFPTQTSLDNFILVRRVMDVIEESVQLAMLQFVDLPISNAMITAVLASVNSFIRTQIQRGALVAGAASYDPAENPSSEIAAGHLTFDLDITPPPPAERITWNVTLDSAPLGQLGATAAATQSAA